ncbi:AAA family ATPase [Variovorax sp. V118]|uniref:ATP-binding protein n=1 Tax=Variovorax sp. V118 TaxID=3065954 RepID=UPI0034E855E0
MASVSEEQEAMWFQRSLAAGKVFTPTSPINAQELFAGRNDQIHQIVDVINQTGQHAILYGERGVGKTSLANVFAGYLGVQRVLAPRVNCDATDTFDSVWRKALEQAGVTQQRQSIGFTTESKTVVMQAADLLGGLATPDSVRRCLTTLSQHFVPVFVIDEFDRLGVEARRAFADCIKALSDHSVPATVLLVGVADSVDQLIAEHHSVQRALAQVRMPRMSNIELDTLLEKGITKLGMKTSIPGKRRIIKLSQGLPHYAHLLALHACRAAIDNRSLEVTTDAVHEALEKALLSTQQSVLSTYETAVRSARKDNLFAKVLLACAMADTNELGEFAAQDVRDYLSQISGRRYEIPSFAQHLKEFTEDKRGPVLTKSGIPRLYRYKFTEPLLQPYVIMQGIKSRLIKVTDLD